MHRQPLALLLLPFTMLVLCGCTDAAASAPASHVSQPTATPVSSKNATASLLKVEQAQIEEACDNLAAKRIRKWKGTDPTFVNPLFSPGAKGKTLVQQRVPYTDVDGTPQTSLMECAGSFRSADNTVDAKLLILTKRI